VIAVECYLDEYLVAQLGVSRKNIKHQSGKGKVLEFVIKNECAMGLIDEDPQSRQPSTLQELVEEGRIGSARLMARKSGGKGHLIQLMPDLENWLVERARANGISMSDFGLPKDASALHDYHHLERNERFREFFEALRKKDKEISDIGRWIGGSIN
jgi:hypothetical protein